MTQRKRLVTTETTLDAIPPDAKALLVSSTGGHLWELAQVAQRLGVARDSLWVTSRNAQSLSMLAARRHHFVDYVPPRDARRAIKAGLTVLQLVRDEKFDVCISTGAAVAALALPLTAARRIPTFYVESLARTEGPSLTGRLMALAPRVQTLTQYESWASARWRFAGSTLDGWSAMIYGQEPAALRIFVTLGTIRPYRFDRAVDAVHAVLGPSDEVVWQLGSTVRTSLPGQVFHEVTFEKFDELATWADVVVSHAGVGSIVRLLELGVSPVLAVRRKGFAEHVDDHQAQIAAAVTDRGLATLLSLEVPSRKVLGRAARVRIAPPATPSTQNWT